jgi:hypothetical protein
MAYRKLQAVYGAYGCGNERCRRCYEWVTVMTRKERELAKK